MLAGGRLRRRISAFVRVGAGDQAVGRLVAHGGNRPPEMGAVDNHAQQHRTAHAAIILPPMKPTWRDVLLLVALQAAASVACTLLLAILGIADGSQNWVSIVGAMMGAQ